MLVCHVTSAGLNTKYGFVCRNTAPSKLDAVCNLLPLCTQEVLEIFFWVPRFRSSGISLPSLPAEPELAAPAAKDAGRRLAKAGSKMVFPA